jgi:uncharacterized protein (DUF2164 family)
MVPELSLPKDSRSAALASLKRYFTENMAEPLGDLPAGLFLDFLLEEIGPLVYNRAIADAQTRLGQRILDLNAELYAEEFPYWRKADEKRKNRRHQGTPRKP